MDNIKQKYYSDMQKYISELDDISRGDYLFCHAKKCVEKGVLQMYKEFYKECDRNLNVFFTSLYEKGYGRGEVINKDKLYRLSFEQCTCHLVKEAYVKSKDFCECSRQSIIYVMKFLDKHKKISVEMTSTILSGDDNCSFIITID